MRWPWQKQPTQQPTWLEVTQAYGAVLENTPAGVGGSRSLVELPYDKSTIKAALVEAAIQDGVTDEQLSALSIGYAELASFRDGGGQPGVFQEKLDPREMSESQMREFARRISEAGDQEIEISKAITAESMTLLAEWQTLTERLGRHA